MNRSLGKVGVLLAFLAPGCAHGAGGGTPESASVAASAAPSSERPAMDGTCSITEGVSVQTFTYAQGRLTESTAMPSDFRTMYTYEGTQLTRIVRTIGGELAFRKELRYDANGHLEAMITLTLGAERTTLQESERRSFEYDTAGRVLRVTDSSPHGGTNRVCTVEYDDHERLASHTCEMPGVEDEEPQRTTYHFDAAGRLSEVRVPFMTFRMHYDAAGRQQRYEAISDTGEVLAGETTVRDAEGHALERRTDTRGGQVAVEQIAFDGNFGAGAECGVAPPAPPGLPEDARTIWFEMAP